MDIIKKIEALIESNKIDEAKALYKENKDEFDEYLARFTYQNVNGHEYSGYNKLYLQMFREPGIYGTFKQWKDKGKKVKKWEKSFLIFMPIFQDDLSWNKVIKYMKKIHIFHETQTEEV